MDQIFVNLKHWAVGVFPDRWQPLVSAVLMVVPILAVFPFLFAVTTVLERKGLGRIQNRYGPNRVGPWGFLQFAADGLKALTKEDVVPRAADPVVHFLAPVVMLVPVFLTFAVIPVGRNMVVWDLDAGLVVFFAVSAVTEMAVFMAGWSSRNKYALLGAMRAIAQMLSYEIPLVLSTLPSVMVAGSMSLVAIVAAQAGADGGWTHWFVATPWGLAAFLVFMIAGAAEANRPPFDLSEGESEIVAGYFIEYSGFKFAMFFIADYLKMFAVCGLGITLFLGGWQAPFAALGGVPSWLWFFGKLFVLVFGLIWVRGTLPRLRIDHLMNFAWKFLLPMALAAMMSAGLWRGLGAGWERWVCCALAVGVPYVVLGRGLTGRRAWQTRTYRYGGEAGG